MQVKRLKLSGFKSFVEPAELKIEPGLTGLVGPNGCGKSNVLEAIRWVMGESSPKSMRGAGMEDVIFAGTAQRPARDFAEASLLVERQAPDLSGDLGIGGGEVEVTRRIERGAGSAYRVNGRDVRAKDVALLFADAATGAHSPALVSQGKISQVIAAKPTERRLMLEEAAGISGLHVRRKDAEQKLRAAETNLARLDEVLADMEQRSTALRRQAKSAERYRKLTEKIRVAEARLLFARWREAAAAADDAKAEAEASVTGVEQAGEAQRAAAAQQAEAAKALAGRRSAAQAAREHSSALGHRLAALRAERDTISRRVKELGERHAALTADRAREEALGEDARTALARLKDEMAAIAARIAEAEAGRGTIDIRTVELEDSAREAETALAKARAVQAAEQAEARVAQAALESALAKLARSEAEATRLAEQMAELGDEAPLVAARRTARVKRESAEAALEKAAQEIGAAEAKRADAAAARDKAESESAAARAALTALQSEAKALLKAVEGAGRDRAINHLKAAPGFEHALAAALGDDLEASLDKSGARSWAGAKIGASDPPLPAGCDRLADHVEAPAALGRRLAQIGVVKADDGSLELAVGQRLVTRDGRLRRWDGFIASGLGAAAAERLIRLNRLAEIEAILPEAGKNVSFAQGRIDAAVAAIEAARQAADSARRREADAAAAIREAGREEDAANVAIERLDVRRTGLAERCAQAEADLTDARQTVETAQKEVAGLPDAAVTEARVAELRTKAEAAQQALAEVRAEAATYARSISADKQRAEAAARESADWNERAAEAAKRHAEFGRRIAATETEAETLAGAPDAIAAQLAAIEAESAEALKAAETAAGAERQAEEALRETEGKLTETAEALASARETRAGALARHEHQESRRIELARIAGDRFECPPPLLPARIGFDADDIADAIAESTALERFSAERERIGPVNLVAEQELTELEEGRIGSQAEREELGLAINRLRGSIGSLNREGRTRLLAAFEAVNAHFRSLFTTLFEGGQAHLELVESEDPLEAGLEIMAQPPGKRLSTLTLLSGGEQALTAVALIFGLFLTNPAPICVLDEVDAPLDDANIERFCDLLDRMVGETHTRYLIVTHNAVTMSRMHRLFGVTMVEKGVSRLVSVDLGGAERLLAAE